MQYKKLITQLDAIGEASQAESNMIFLIRQYLSTLDNPTEETNIYLSDWLQWLRTQGEFHRLASIQSEAPVLRSLFTKWQEVHVQKADEMNPEPFHELWHRFCLEVNPEDAGHEDIAATVKHKVLAAQLKIRLESAGLVDAKWLELAMKIYENGPLENESRDEWELLHLLNSTAWSHHAEENDQYSGYAEDDEGWLSCIDEKSLSAKTQELYLSWFGFLSHVRHEAQVMATLAQQHVMSDTAPKTPPSQWHQQLAEECFSTTGWFSVDSNRLSTVDLIDMFWGGKPSDADRQRHVAKTVFTARNDTRNHMRQLMLLHRCTSQEAQKEVRLFVQQSLSEEHASPVVIFFLAESDNWLSQLQNSGITVNRCDEPLAPGEVKTAEVQLCSNLDDLPQFNELMRYGHYLVDLRMFFQNHYQIPFAHLSPYAKKLLEKNPELKIKLQNDVLSYIATKTSTADEPVATLVPEWSYDPRANRMTCRHIWAYDHDVLAARHKTAFGLNVAEYENPVAQLLALWRPAVVSALEPVELETDIEYDVETYNTMCTCKTAKEVLQQFAIFKGRLYHTDYLRLIVASPSQMAEFSLAEQLQLHEALNTITFKQRKAPPTIGPIFDVQRQSPVPYLSLQGTPLPQVLGAIGDHIEEGGSLDEFLLEGEPLSDFAKWVVGSQLEDYIQNQQDEAELGVGFSWFLPYIGTWKWQCPDDVASIPEKYFIELDGSVFDIRHVLRAGDTYHLNPNDDNKPFSLDALCKLLSHPEAAQYIPIPTMILEIDEPPTEEMIEANRKVCFTWKRDSRKGLEEPWITSAVMFSEEGKWQEATTQSFVKALRDQDMTMKLALRYPALHYSQSMSNDKILNGIISRNRFKDIDPEDIAAVGDLLIDSNLFSSHPLSSCALYVVYRCNKAQRSMIQAYFNLDPSLSRQAAVLRDAIMSPPIVVSDLILLGNQFCSETERLAQDEHFITNSAGLSHEDYVRLAIELTHYPTQHPVGSGREGHCIANDYRPEERIFLTSGLYHAPRLLNTLLAWKGHNIGRPLEEANLAGVMLTDYDVWVIKTDPRMLSLVELYDIPVDYANDIDDSGTLMTHTDIPVTQIPVEHFIELDGWIFDATDLVDTAEMEDILDLHVNPITNNKFSDEALTKLRQHPTTAELMLRADEAYADASNDDLPEQLGVAVVKQLLVAAWAIDYDHQADTLGDDRPMTSLELTKLNEVVDSSGSTDATALLARPIYFVSRENQLKSFAFKHCLTGEGHLCSAYAQRNMWVVLNSLAPEVPVPISVQQYWDAREVGVEGFPKFTEVSTDEAYGVVDALDLINQKMAEKFGGKWPDMDNWPEACPLNGRHATEAMTFAAYLFEHGGIGEAMEEGIEPGL